MSGSGLSISVVVPALNAEETIGLCLESLQRQRSPACEVIVVDNGSRDRTTEIVSRASSRSPVPPTILLTEQKPGPSAARNRGIRAAQGDVVAFTDADCVASPNWLHDLAPAFADDMIDGVAGNIRGYQPHTLLDKFQSLFTLRHGLGREQIFDRYTLTEGGFPTANLAVRREILEKIGGFNESLPIYTEDHDLCRRIYREGGRIKAIPGGAVFHIHRRTLLRFLRQSFGFGRGHAQLLDTSSARMVLLQLPFRTLQTERLPGRIWLNLVSLDKKVAVLLALALAYPPASVLLPLYLLSLTRRVRARGRSAGEETGWGEGIGMVSLLLLKDLAIDCGRWYGSIRHRVVCL